MIKVNLLSFLTVVCRLSSMLATTSPVCRSLSRTCLLVPLPASKPVFLCVCFILFTFQSTQIIQPTWPQSSVSFTDTLIDRFFFVGFFCVVGFFLRGGYVQLERGRAHSALQPRIFLTTTAATSSLELDILREIGWNTVIMRASGREGGTVRIASGLRCCATSSSSLHHD